MLDRTHPPAFVKSNSFQLPQASIAKLPMGVKVIHLDNTHQELAKIELVFDAGRWFEPKPEVSHFTVQMLDKGTMSMSSREIAEIFDRYGAHIELNSNFDFATVSLYALSKHIHLLIPILFEILTSPAFNESELVQLKEHYIQALRIKNEKTSYVASKLIRQKVFGSEHPYGKSAEIEDVENITLSDLTDFFTSRMKPSYVFILGKVNQNDYNELTKRINELGIANSNVPTYAFPDQQRPPEYLTKSGSVQTSIRFGKSTVQRNHPDYPGLLLLNYYLGGYFGSRLMKNLREEKGLTYGISSSISSFKNESLILIGTDVNRENRGLAIEEIIQEIKLLQTTIHADELELAKRHFIGSLQGEMASPFSIIGKIKNIELHELPNDYYQNLISSIDQFTSNQLSELAQEYFNEGSFSQISVG
jgi:predicted Zn-dependent peptidase